MKACIGSLWIALLVNGRPTYFFYLSRGIWQGCALTPYLYIVMTVVLSRMLEAERQQGNITNIGITVGVKELNHSQFANDTLLIDGASINIAKRFKKILGSFSIVTGRKINKNKSNIYSWKTNQRTFKCLWAYETWYIFHCRQ